MAEAWVEELLKQNAEIVAADAQVRALLRQLHELRQGGQDKSEAASQLTTELSQLLRLREHRDHHLLKGIDTA